MLEFKVIQHSVFTLEGYGAEGLCHANQMLNKEVLYPKSLKGLSPKIDFATGITVSSVKKLEPCLEHVDKEKIGIVVGTRLGNHLIAKKYSDLVRRSSVSPSAYSTSGYNICAGLAALATQYKGPTIVLPGNHSKMADCIILGANYLMRNDADVVIVGQVDITNNGTWGGSTFLSLAKNTDNHQGICFSIEDKGLCELYQVSDSLKDASIYSTYMHDAYKFLSFCDNERVGDILSLKSSLNLFVNFVKGDGSSDKH